jgi:hypothetical protein
MDDVSQIITGRIEIILIEILDILIWTWIDERCIIIIWRNVYLVKFLLFYWYIAFVCFLIYKQIYLIRQYN